MKKFFVLLCVPFAGIAHATTLNIDWLMDGSTYAQTTCETGGNFSLPATTPTKYGYHFVGWQQNDAIGSWSQSGTPTPDNPIYPTFAQYGNTTLRALGSGDNFVADTYDPTTGKITRRVGVKVLDGTEDWIVVSGAYSYFRTNDIVNCITDSDLYCNNFVRVTIGVGSNNQGVRLYREGNTSALFLRYDNLYSATTANIPLLKQWLADQYAAGTPVTIYYPLATPVEEDYNAQ